MLTSKMSSKKTVTEIQRPAKFGLTLERETFDKLGYVSPLPLQDFRQVNSVLDEHPFDAKYTRNPHVSSPAIQRLLSDKNLQDAVEFFCGKQLLIWRSACFTKSFGADEIGWHHDKHFHDASASNIILDDLSSHFSVLIALTDMNIDDGILEIVPGTHRTVSDLDRDVRPFHLRPTSDHMLDLPEPVFASRRKIPIPAGCFLIFHSALLHRSLPHSAPSRRAGLAIRLMRKGLKVPKQMAQSHEILPFEPVGMS